MEAKPTPLPFTGAEAKPTPLPFTGAEAIPTPLPFREMEAKPTPLPFIGAEAKPTPLPFTGAEAIPTPLPFRGGSYSTTLKISILKCQVQFGWLIVGQRLNSEVDFHYFIVYDNRNFLQNEKYCSLQKLSHFLNLKNTGNYSMRTNFNRNSQ